MTTLSHYVNMDVRPDGDFPSSQLMGALYVRLHRALVAHGAGDIGVCFPAHNEHWLGNRMRLHGSAEALGKLMGVDWLQGMRDHLDLTPVSPVPDQMGYRQVKRVQPQSSPERLRRRLMLRHKLTAEEAAERIPDTVAQLVALPSVFVRSSSTGQSFRLFVCHGPLTPEPKEGGFSTYGLSLGGAVPWF
ncbi:type I-F CRISPR-associated endoribonuclease Cas6/Csy4 [Candidatus Symbiobacter mobilis]|uniref:CRISPR-associated protein Csy4 n=1 Tax=Candidatus Symbiobacter mobilis CR TaxID=946483 RepID=U5NAD5_9BURK|nr:type I-F CRISPR-associated endoribonuclease Cas6/Csy4 [Candidatus Symbiobacter mobilis]AGX88280.1 CRISPR-associated protein Csy4 [Candidatus Symbiobacter mobilis CR]